MSQVRVKEKKMNRWSWPLIGFGLILSMGVIAYFLAPPVAQWIDRRPGFTVQGMPYAHFELAVGAIIFVLLVAVAALIVAALAPRKAMNVNEKMLIKERQRMHAEKKAKKVLARRMSQENRKASTQQRK